MVHPGQVQDAVDDRLDQVLGVLGADEDVPQLALEAGARSVLVVLVDRERQDVGRPFLLAPGLVELGDPLGVDELDRDVAVLDPRGRGRVGDRLLHAARRASVLPITSISSNVKPSSRAPAMIAGGTQPAGLLGVMSVVGLDDPLHELVAHDVVAAEAHELDALDVLEDVADDDQPGLLRRAAGRPA